MQEFYFDNRIYYKKNTFIPGRKTIVFVHGVFGSSSAWIVYEEKFKDEYNIVSLDLRGHGKSKKLPKYGDYEMKKIAEDIETLLDYLNIQTCIMVSHSLGTFVVLEFFALHSNKISGLIFLGSNYSVKHRIASRLMYVLLWPVPLLDLFPFTEKKGVQVDYAKYPYKADFDIRRMYEDISNTFLRICLYCLRQLYAVDNENVLEKIHVPVLIIHGKKDTVFPYKKAIEFSRKIKNSKLILVEKGNHLLLFNNTSEICEKIAEFVSTIKN
ncbi:MAG: alpha/beta hydrolase [bacterium]